MSKKCKGQVIKSTGSWYKVQPEGEASPVNARIRGKFRQSGFQTSNPVAVGDLVLLEMIAENEGVIVTIYERRNQIIRRLDKGKSRLHLIAANVDQAVLIASLKAPKVSTGFIDRFLLTAEAFHIPAVLVFNKADLLTSAKDRDYLAEIKSIYHEKVGYPFIETAATSGMGKAALSEVLAQKCSLFIGQSGVGKSSLLNAISPDLQLRIGSISEKHQKGKHTTTFAEMLNLDAATRVIDTPGIRDFKIIDFDAYEVSHFFPEMKALLPQCKFHNCLHINEPKCAVKAAVESGEISAMRYHNYRSIIENKANY